MKKQNDNSSNPDHLEKMASGIEGFDDITGGGIPQRRTTLVMGGPGSGKTVLVLQMLVNGAVHNDTPGIFVAFEESARRVVANAEGFGWNMAELEKKRLVFVDARMRPDVVKAGAFDLTALLSALETKARETGAKLIVFDAIDVLLGLIDNSTTEHRELYRLHEWLMQTGLTGILTTKVEQNTHDSPPRHEFMSFMADCVVMLRQRVVDRIAVREMRVLKYRGSSHVLNDVPFVIGSAGLEVGSSNGVHPEPQPFQERVSSGVERLDAMLSGGYFRGTNILITGSSGAGKSTLAGIFVEAACRRGERALYISFDESSLDIVRDLASVGVQLAPHLASGLLRTECIRSGGASSEEHLLRIKRVIRDHKPACVAIDPLSVLENVGGALAARSIADRLIYLCRNERITALFTSLIEGTDPQLETTALHMSTMADSWLQITYSLHAGERNRALTIIKSRGSKHSNQMRELVFSETGITLADPYTAGGEVLMGALRIEKENAVRAERDQKQHAIDQKRREVELIIAERDLRLDAAQRDLHNRAEELSTLTLARETNITEGTQHRDEVISERDSALVREQSDGSKTGRRLRPAAAAAEVTGKPK